MVKPSLPAVSSILFTGKAQTTFLPLLKALISPSAIDESAYTPLCH